MKPQQSKSESKCVYHYTGANTIPNILREDKLVLRLTHTDYMNDMSEGKQIYSILQNTSKQLLAEKRISIELYQKIITLIKIPSLEFPIKYRDRNNAYYIEWKECDAYTMSFSTDSDNLPMWNYYANAGYCLHFNTYFLEKLFPVEFPCYCKSEPITYESEMKEKIAENILRIAQLEAGEIEEKLYDYISDIRYFCKADAFLHEKEYRLFLAVPKDSKKLIPIKLFDRDGYERPCIEIEIDDFLLMQKLIQGITVGPLTNDECAVQELLSLIKERAYTRIAQNVQFSNIPVRF